MVLYVAVPFFVVFRWLLIFSECLTSYPLEDVCCLINVCCCLSSSLSAAPAPNEWIRRRAGRRVEKAIDLGREMKSCCCTLASLFVIRPPPRSDDLGPRTHTFSVTHMLFSSLPPLLPIYHSAFLEPHGGRVLVVAPLHIPPGPAAPTVLLHPIILPQA